NEVVLFRHEKTFYHPPGLFIRIRDDFPEADIDNLVRQIEDYQVNYVGIDLVVDGFALEASSKDADIFTGAVSRVRAISKKPLILISQDPALLAAGLQALDGEAPMICAANETNWEPMAELAKNRGVPLAVSADSLEALAGLVEKISSLGIEDLVLDPGAVELGSNLTVSTQIRRLALKSNFRPLGYPIITFPGSTGSLVRESLAAAQAIVKYAGFIVLDSCDPELLYALLVLRQNIYTDPQKPIQVQPGLYEINNPGPDDPLLATTNFSITYFSVANEVEGSGQPAWLLVCDAEGMSVLTAWAAGKFDAERIAKDVKEFGVTEKVAARRIILPGHVAVLSGEVEEELPGWEVRVGPREAVDLPAFMKEAL
ncbi:MAG: acetyl-CoA decarbonylase/synthase complex subunit gamma, partial [Anaerolineales bacterium]|nr:acetyl-CoA decarbonylase/synthase complex subunit gamma [Anaerolineales bacterium]